MVKKLFATAFLAVLTFAAAIPSQAQQKDWAIGLRLGEPTGLNVKKYIGKSNALDINVGAYGTFYGSRAYRDGYWRRGGALMVNYLWQKRIPNAAGLQWYYGLGGQLSFRNYYYWHDKKSYTYYEESTSVGFGATGMIGIEYFIPKSPISLYADVTPYLELFPSAFFLNLQAGIGGRFNF